MFAIPKCYKLVTCIEQIGLVVLKECFFHYILAMKYIVV